MRQEERAKKIRKIQGMIMSEIEHKRFDKKKVILASMANLHLSKITAKEYVEVALFNEGLDLK